MSDLRATNFKGRTSGSVPNMPDGVVVGSAVTISSSGIDVGASGIITATTFSGTVSSSTGSFSGDVDIADKIVHTGDTNTAIRFPAADTFTVETAGTERLRITSGGLIGINTTPGTLLELLGESSKEADITFNRQPVQGTNDGVIGQLLFENATDSVAQISVKRESAADDAYIQFATQATGGSYGERLRITSGGDVRIGTTNAVVFGSRRALTVANGTTGAVLSLYNSTTATNNPRISSNPGGSEINDIGIHAASTNGNIQFYTNNDTERLRITSAGQVLVNTSSSKAAGGVTADLQIEGTSTGSLRITRNASDAAPPHLVFSKSGGTSIGSNTTVDDDDNLGRIRFAGADGTDHASIGAEISAAVDGTPGGNDMPARLVFSTTADGAASPTERMRIHSGGVVSFNNGIELGSGLDATAANTLEDYEEGTFTPTINTGFTAGYNSQAGRYTKVGNVVHFFISIDLSSLSGSSSDAYAEVEGLPFTATNTGNIDNAVTVAWQMNLGNSVYHAYIEQNATHIVLLGEPSSGSRTHWNPGQVWDDSDGRIALSGTYTTAS